MYIEEHGALPEDMEDAERASRERRARRRMGWAEDTMRRQTRVKEDTSLGVRAAKKRRRNGGCWISENGVFVRLVSPIEDCGTFRLWTRPRFHFAVCASKMKR
jgi:hypothetical protein